MEKVNVTETCWLWTGALSRGYGRFRVNGQEYKAHRLVLAEKLGRPIAQEMEAAHAPEICHNKACVNPEHLREATKKENASDRIIDGTDSSGSKHGRAILTESDIPLIRSDIRSLTEIASVFGVTYHAIYKIKAGHTWKHIT